MRLMERHEVYLICWIGLINLAAVANGDVLIAKCEKQSYCEFEKWCVRQKVNMDFCEGKNCDETLAAGKLCELVLPFEVYGISELQQWYACNYYSPYETSGVGKNKDSLRCTYATSHWCRDTLAKQIGNSCYRLSSKAVKFTGSVAEVAKSCDNGYTMLKSNDSKVLMWASILLDHHYQPLWINNKKPPSWTVPMALSTRSDGMRDREIGDIFDPNDETLELKTLCVKQAEEIPNEDKYENVYGHVEYFLTDNVYQPYNSKDGKIVKKYCAVYPLL